VSTSISSILVQVLLVGCEHEYIQYSGASTVGWLVHDLRSS